jgi:hypothetical protein
MVPPPGVQWINASTYGLVIGAWRQIKAGTARFSIGYMAKNRALPDGGRELYEIDLLEISITSTPMNAATRALSWKSAADRSALAELESVLEGWKRVDAMWRAGLLDEVPSRKSVSTAPVRVERFEVE